MEPCKAGRCVACGGALARGATRELVLPLSNGSRLRVAVCSSCGPRADALDKREIWESVLAGWELEMDRLDHWAPEMKRRYMDQMRKVEIR